MKLYPWVIIGFRKNEKGGVSCDQYLCYSWCADTDALAMEIEAKIRVQFPETEGWFETDYSIFPGIFSASIQSPLMGRVE